MEELEEEVASLKACGDEDRRRVAKLEQQLGKLQDHVIEQHNKGFDLAVQQVAFFYKIPTDEGKFDNQKAFFKGELLPLAEIPNSSEEVADKEEEERKSRAVRRQATIRQLGGMGGLPGYCKFF